MSGSAAGPAEVAGSLATVGAITVGAGWLAGPLADGPQRRLVAGGFGYAIAVLAVTLTLGAIQGGRDFPDGTDLVGIVSLTLARLAYGALYLVLPAIALGMLWSLAVSRLSSLARSRRP